MRKIISVALCFLLSNVLIQVLNAKDKIRVVATTTLIGTIVQEISKGKVAVTILVPGGMCPGHFDIAPNTAKQIAAADVFIRHGWEKWADNFIKGAGKSSGKNIQLKTEDNWMVPDINIRAAEEIEKILSSEDKNNEPFYETNLMQYRRKVINKAEELHHRFRKYRNKKIICSEQQKEFLEWLKLTVVGTYQRPEDLNIKEISKLVAASKAQKVVLVVDNLQSGPGTGAEIAKDLKARHVVLTNFPRTDSYIETLEYNAGELEKGLQ